MDPAAHRPWSLIPVLSGTRRRASAETSVRDLQCGHLDLLLVHWPEAWLPGTQEPDTTVSLRQTW